MLKLAFPQGIPRSQYLPLLVVLYEIMSQRAIAELMTYITDRIYTEALHDVMTARAEPPSEAEVEKVKRCLIPFGYEEWLKEK